MSAATRQEAVKETLWRVCEAAGGGAAKISDDQLVTLVFVQCLSALWDDQQTMQLALKGDDAALHSNAFALPEIAHFDYLRQRRREPGNGARIDAALQAIMAANSTLFARLFDVVGFGNGDDPSQNSAKDEALHNFLEGLGQLDLRPSHLGGRAALGKTFEYVIHQIAAAGSQLWMHTSPPEVAQLVAALVAPAPGDDIFDPACGAGGFLIACAQTRGARSRTANKGALFGQDSHPLASALTRMNLFLHGEQGEIALGDTLLKPKFVTAEGGLKRFDIAVADLLSALPDWSVDIGGPDLYGRFERGLPPKNRHEYAFIQHMLKSLGPEGRMAVVTAPGPLYRVGVEAEIRQQLIEENLLDAVIGLPDKLFYGTNVPGAILVFNQDKADDKVLFIDASQGFSRLNRRQNRLAPAHIHAITDAYRTRQSQADFAHLADLDELRANDFNCTIGRYVRSPPSTEAANIVAIRRERELLKAELSVLEAQIAGQLAALSELSEQ